MTKQARLMILLAALIGGARCSLAEGVRDPFDREPQLKSLTTAEARQRFDAWLDAQDASETARVEAAELWANGDDPRGAELLERVARSIAVVDERAARIVATCDSDSALALPDAGWLTESAEKDFERANLRLMYGRWLAKHQLYEEARQQLEGLTPEDVIDPATLLFYQAVSYHRLLDQEQGLSVLKRLQHDVADSPERYLAVATLMQSDLEALEEESLDHISRRMDDIRRRLDLGRAGPKTREVEDGVIASLDKMIEEMEQQQQQQQQQQSGGGSNTPAMPMPDSRIAGGSGPGETKRRDLGDTSGWGALPPKEREAALQQIGKDFPSHYRDVVEEYFRRLATQRPAGAGE